MNLERIVQTIALKVIGTLDIEEALVETRNALTQWIPADELFLFQMSEDENEVFLICRVDAEGIRSINRQSLFLLNKQEVKVRKNRLDEAETDFVVLRRCDMTQEISGRHLSASLEHFGIPAHSDDLVLFNRKLNAGIGVVSYLDNSYTTEHVKLFEALREPFSTAISNAMRFQQLQQNRDALIDDNQLFREVTVQLTSESDIAKAFQRTVAFLSNHIPIQELILVTTDVSSSSQQVLLRARNDGEINEKRELIDMGISTELIAKRQKLMEAMPNTFVTDMLDDELVQTIDPALREEKAALLGLNPDTYIAVLGVKNLQAAILFVFANQASCLPRHMEIIHMLKEPFVIALHNAIRFYELERIKERLQDENRALQNELQKEVGDRVVGMHHGLKHVMELAGQVAKTASPVLLLGETGSGKEVIATSIHRLSQRSERPFISLNCGAIPETLIDSELFGHEKGSFTGANERKLGRFERADGGTLFLDEVGELPPSAQVKLLRVLQEKEFERIGGNRSIRADVRLIAATNRDLPSMIRKGEFREDLWFRLNVFPMTIPPLRKRQEDIPSLAYFFIESRSRQLNLPWRPSLPAAELDKLVQYDWPGNVRELQNAIERALILSRGEPLQFPYLSSVFGVGNTMTSIPAPPVSPKLISFEEASRDYFRSLLTQTNGRISGPNGAASIAKMNPNTLRSKLKKLGLL